MKIINHRVEGVEFQSSPNQGGIIRPTHIVMHDTAGPSLASAQNWFTQAEARASAHFIIGRDGDIIQMVDMNKKAWHAGASVWKSRQNVSGFSVGIELVNPGKLTKVDVDTYKPWYRGTVQDHKSPGTAAGQVRHGAMEYLGVKWSGYWLDYPETQMETARKLVAAIRDNYSIPKSNVLTHWMVSPGRKTDTNPLFRMDQLLSSAGEPLPKEEQEPVPLGKAARIKNTLNLRQWPSLYKTNIMRVIPAGTAVMAIKTSIYERIGDGITPDGTQIKWTQVRSGDLVGWVMDQYLERIE